jgi:hypothetical protein
VSDTVEVERSAPWRRLRAVMDGLRLSHECKRKLTLKSGRVLTPSRFSTK